ncbi:MAG: hypothetical protein ACM30G_22215 [Micromonosporaceae bacterium]
MDPDRTRWAALTPLAVAAGIAASGFGLGWLWSTLAPRIALIKVDGGFVYADTEPEQPIAADGWFLLLGLAAGLLFGILAWTLRRHRGPVMLVALTVGCLGAAWIAWWFGHQLDLAELNRLRLAAPIGARVQAPLGLRITGLDPHEAWLPRLTGVAAAPALAAVFCYTSLAGFSNYASLRGPEPVPVAPEPPAETDQFGPGRAGSSESATGTALT